RRLSNHWSGLCREVFYHCDRWRCRHSQRNGFRVRPVRHHQSDSDLCHHAGIRRGGAVSCGNRFDPAIAAGDHRPLLPEGSVNDRALNALGLALVGIVGAAFLILTPRLAELDIVLELTVFMIMAILALSLALVWG